MIPSETTASSGRMGSLKIFFGYAAGVGKTYAMLAAAHKARQAGIDVVAGYVEPHMRPETQDLLQGLEVLPTLILHHGGLELHEFDLDAAIRRSPRLILVDEMAHTNVRGCRHLKRYQDIQELLRHGIDVYTTVNVQHVESLNDVVQSITGVEVRERVPDKVFDGATHVELVDIEPETLLARLQQGKIYQKEQARTALGNFFVLENLVALREIALRRTADIVSKTVEKNKALQQRSDYFTHEHVLVCLSSSPSNPRVIRTAARMAEAFHSKLTALFVETSTIRAGTKSGGLSADNKARLDANAHLAEQLGAQLVSVQGDDIAWQVAEFAKLGNVSKIVMGRPGKERSLFHRANFIDQITALAPHLDVYVIPDGGPEKTAKKVSPHPKSSQGIWRLPSLHFSGRECAVCTGFLAASTVLGLVFHALGFREATIIMAYMLGVLFSALHTSGLFAIVFSALGSVLAFNLFFTTPRLSFDVEDPAHWVTFGMMLVVSAIISSQTKRLQQQRTLAAHKAHRTALLLETSLTLQGARDEHEIIRETGRQLSRLLNRPIIFYPEHDGRLASPLIMADTSINAEGYTAKEERAVAEWSLRNRKLAGAGTDTLPGARCLYLCIRGQDEALGVVGVPAQPAPVDTFEKSLLTAVLSECALALEKERIRTSKDKAFIQARHEALRANLLRAISHDLRTPLTSISGNAQMLLAKGKALSDDIHQRLCKNMYDDAAWLISLVENILAVTRLEDGSAPLKLEVELVEDCIHEAINHASRHVEEHRVQACFEGVLLARMDTRLIMQVLVNLVDNAVKYSPSGSTIIVNAAQHGEYVAISVGDEGAGIPDDAKERLFDMFFTLPHTTDTPTDSRRGLGLGLYLCKSIVAAHGGRIWVENNTPCGSLFIFTLPMALPEPDAEMQNA